MSEEQLALSRTLVRVNGRSLLDDAQLLLAAKRFPRAVALAILACEEFAKIPMFARAQASLANREPVDWERLAARLQDHREKLGLLDLFDKMMGPLPTEPVALSELLRSAGREGKFARDLQRLKLEAIYCTFERGFPILPAGFIDEGLATRYVQAAGRVGSYFDQLEGAPGVETAAFLAALDQVVSKEQPGHID